MFIFSLDVKGQLLYANEWLTKYTGETTESLNKTKWKAVVLAEDYEAFSLLFRKPIAKGDITIKTVSLTPFTDEKEHLQYWIGYIVDIHAQKVVEETLKDNVESKQTQAHIKENQQTLERYIEELNRSNQELQQFAFIASHDLQEPIRKLLFYSDYLGTRYTNSIDQKGPGAYWKQTLQKRSFPA